MSVIRNDRGPADFVPLAVRHVTPLTADSVAIQIEVPGALGGEFEQQPGQHLVVRDVVGGVEERRNYSICSWNDPGTLTIGVKHLEGGAISTRLHELEAGDVLEAMPPTGRFVLTLDPSNAKRYAGVAAGSGITPLLAMVKAVLETEPNSTLDLVYGNSRAQSVMFLDELEDLRSAHMGRLTLMHVLYREPQGSDLLQGRIDAQKIRTIAERLLPPASVDAWLLCGPRETVDVVKATLVELGVDPAHTHSELFFAGVAPAVSDAELAARAPSGGQLTMRLNSHVSHLVIPPDGTTVLAAARLERSDVPYSCTSGVCGTCRAKVLSGSLEMRQNFALESDEVERGYVRTCQSILTSDEAEIDYDA